jgi:hypothetical protein
MGRLCMELYLKQLRKRYEQATRSEKGQILDEFCKTSGYHRKHANRLLNQGVRRSQRRKCGRKVEYDPAVLLQPLKRIWLATNQMCGRRLKEALPLWLPHYQSNYGPIEVATVESLMKMSSSTIDRFLKPLRAQHKPRYGGTKPGKILKTHIPINTEQWNIQEPGFVEADTVAHCGDSMSGSFIWSLTFTDLCSGWTELRAVWNKGAHGVVEQIQDIEAGLPFRLKGFDCDNGSEFLNYHLIHYFAGKTREPIQFTRSRPYHKDDNAHVEQKNWTHVRQLLGYYRLDDQRLTPLINDLYKNEISQLNNFFCPSFKLIEKSRIHSKIVKKHDKPMTPYHRLMGCSSIGEEIKNSLTQQYAMLDPFSLQERIEKKLKKIFALVDVKVRSNRTAI